MCVKETEGGVWGRGLMAGTRNAETDLKCFDGKKTVKQKIN